MIAATRPPAVAGRFYPADVGRLTAFLEEHLVPAPAPAAPVRAVIVPHAGYAYSGATAARAFTALGPWRWRRAIVIGPSHYVPFRGVAAAPQRAFRTPLGDLPLDTDACRALGEAGPRFHLREDVHAPEHSLEVELPFVQYLAPAGVTLLPLACGDMMLDDIVETAERLLPWWDAETLLIVSSDFTHYGEHFGYWPFPVTEAPDKLPELDGGALKLLQAGDAMGFLTYIEETGATICGRFPIAILLTMMRLAGVKPAIDLLQYTTSAAVTHDYHSSVSYAALTVRG